MAFTRLAVVESDPDKRLMCGKCGSRQFVYHPGDATKYELTGPPQKNKKVHRIRRSGRKTWVFPHADVVRCGNRECRSGNHRTRFLLKRTPNRELGRGR